jgi:hypothetical protein
MGAPILKAVAVAALLVLASVPASAEPISCSRPAESDFRVVCSRTWKFTAACTGLDMWDDWSVIGPSEGPFVRPWLDAPITIVGYELLKLHDRSLLTRLRSWFRLTAWSAWARSLIHSSDSWFMVGSTIWPDGMIWLGPDETHAKQMWAPGHGQPWPSAANAAPLKRNKDANEKTLSISGDLVDLHGACFVGSVDIFLTIYYTPQ